MVAQLKVNVSLRRKWWLRIMMSALVALAWVLPRSIKQRIDAERLARWMLRHGFVMKINGRKVSFNP